MLNEILKYDDTYMALLTLIVYLLLWSRIGNKELGLFIYLVINIIFTTVTNIMGYYRINNLFLYHFYSLFEVAFLSFYILKKINGTLNRKIYLAINTFYLVIWLLDVIFFEPLEVYNSNTASLSNLIILALCMYYMLQLAKSDEILNFQKLPSFWITSAFFVYSATSILVFAVYKYYILSNMIEEGTRVYVGIMHIPIMAKFIMLSVGLLCYKRQSSQQLLLL